MSPIWPVALITYKEGIRNRALYGITLLALFLLLATHVVSGLIMREVGKVAVDMALSTVSLAGLLLVFFVVISLLAKDLDKKTIYMVITRPVSREQYVLGKYFGIALLILVSMAVLSILAGLSILLVKTTTSPVYFDRFSWAMVGLSLVCTTLSLLVLAALSVLFSTLTSTSFVAQILTMIAYIIGQSLNDVKSLIETTAKTTGGETSPAIVYMVKIAYYLFPNLSLFDIKLQAAHGLPIAPVYFVWTILYAAVYICLAIYIAMRIFRRREFP